MLWLDLRSDQELRKICGTASLTRIRIEEAACPYSAPDRHAALTELAKLMTDDLHVFRLHQLWKLIEQKLLNDAEAIK